MATPPATPGNPAPNRPAGNPGSKPAIAPAKPASAIRPAIPPAKSNPAPAKPASGIRPPATAPAKPASGVRPAQAGPIRPASGIRPAAPSSQSGRKPAATGNVTSDREALGLTAMKPSEMIKGLDEAAKKAEKMEEREEAKRRSGGKMSANAALLTDDTGRRWTRATNLVISGAIAAVVIGGLILMWLANREPIDPRTGNEQARRDLIELSLRAKRIKPFEESEKITEAAFKERLLLQIDAELKTVEDAIEKDRQKRKDTKSSGAPRDSRLFRDQRELQRLREFKDAWGQPFVFKMADADTVTVTAKGKTGKGYTPPEPVAISNLRGGKPSNPGAAEKPEKAQ